MADIKLVVKIDEKLYKDIYSDAEIMIYGGMRSGKTLLATLLRAIRNGTPLPKGHGDLKDANNLKQAFVMWSMAVQGNFTDADIASIIYNSPTIIEADKEE